MVDRTDQRAATLQTSDRERDRHASRAIPGLFVPQDEPLSSHASNRVANRLIAAQPQPDRNRILECCEAVELTGGLVLCESDEPLTHAYFPLVGFVSLGASLRGRQPLEMGLIGNEGMLGAALVLGVDSSPMTAVVRGAGAALRLSTTQLQRELEHSPSLRCTLDRYLYVLIAQLSHTAACTHFHEIEPRLARWLLMAHDRAHADRFHLTHGFLADILGVRRSGVTIAAGALQQRGLIGYTRGDMQILDRRGLEAASCACYETLRADYTRLLP